MEAKPRLLYLQKILLERTDEENPLSTSQIIEILSDEYGPQSRMEVKILYHQTR